MEHDVGPAVDRARWVNPVIPGVPKITGAGVPPINRTRRDNGKRGNHADPGCEREEPVPRHAALAEALPPRQVYFRIDEVAVALDVAVLAADDEDDRVLVADARDPARLGRDGVKQPA